MENIYFSNQDIAGIGNTIKLYILKGALGPADNAIKSMYRTFNNVLNGKMDVEDQGFLIDVIQECQAELDEAKQPVHIGTAMHEMIDLVRENQELKAKCDAATMQNVDLRTRIEELQDYIECLHDRAAGRESDIEDLQLENGNLETDNDQLTKRLQVVEEQHLEAVQNWSRLIDANKSLADKWRAANENANKWCKRAYELADELDAIKTAPKFIEVDPDEYLGLPELEPEVCCNNCQENNDGKGCSRGVPYSQACLGDKWPFEYNRFDPK